MGKTISKLLALVFVITLLAGCVIVINNGKPTADEQNLMNIQGQSSQEVAKLSQKIQSGDYSVTQIQDLIAEAKKVLDENLKKIDSLQLPARAKEMAEKTRDYLVKAQQTFQSFLQMSTQTNEQVQQLIAKLKNMYEPLLNMAKQMEDLKNQFLAELQKAAASK